MQSHAGIKIVPLHCEPAVRRGKPINLTLNIENHYLEPLEECCLKIKLNETVQTRLTIPLIDNVVSGINFQIETAGLPPGDHNLSCKLYQGDSIVAAFDTEINLY